MRKKIPKDQVVLGDPCGSFHAFMRKNFCVSEVRLGNRVNLSLAMIKTTAGKIKVV